MKRRSIDPRAFQHFLDVASTPLHGCPVGRAPYTEVFPDSYTGAMMGVSAFYGGDLHEWGANLAFILLLWIVWLCIAGFALVNIRHQSR